MKLGYKTDNKKELKLRAISCILGIGGVIGVSAALNFNLWVAASMYSLLISTLTWQEHSYIKIHRKIREGLI